MTEREKLINIISDLPRMKVCFSRRSKVAIEIADFILEDRKQQPKTLAGVVWPSKLDNPYCCEYENGANNMHDRFMAILKENGVV